MSAPISTGRRSLRIALGLVVLPLAAACMDNSVTAPHETAVSELSLNLDRGDDGLTVMNQNVYVGGNVDRVLFGTPDQVPLLVAITFAEVLSTNAPARMGAIADEIARRRPHLIGLQEISIILRQSPGDFFIGNPQPATQVVFNYLDLLMAALAAHGLDYQVAGIVQNADVELPMLVDPSGPSFDDVRLIDHDVVLARGDVQVSDVVAANFDDALTVLGIEIKRGYVALDATVRNRTYRFANTHLEPFDLGIKTGQAIDLIAALDGEDLPVVLVGDLNTPAPGGPVYQLFLQEGYIDTWPLNLKKGEGAGLTNPHDSDLRNEQVNFTQRIDYVLVKNRNRGTSVLGAVFATVFGDEPSERLPIGLWPSDHGGVIVEARIPALGPKAYAE